MGINYKRLITGFILSLAMMGPDVLLAQDYASDETSADAKDQTPAEKTGETEEGVPAEELDDMLWVWFPTAQCPKEENPSEPGGSPDNPIPLTELDDLIGDVYEKERQLNCKWVKTEGYFRWTDYYHYRGNLFPSSRAYYFDSGFYAIIENFASKKTYRAELNGSHVGVVGRFYDLCKAADEAEAASGEDWFILGGPCHYGKDKGIMLRDVFVTETKGRPYRILSGEANRETIGDIFHAPSDWGHFAPVKQAALSWLKTIIRGKSTYEDAVKDNYLDLEEEFEEHIASSDTWYAYLSDPDRSVVANLGGNLEDLQFTPFVYDLLDESPYKDRRALGCFCLISNCANQWPLLAVDAENFAQDFVCTELEYDEEENSWDWLRSWF